MRRLSLAIAAVLTLSGGVAGAQILPMKATSADLPLAAGEASYVTLDGSVRDVVVADPAVADVSVVNERTLIVMGKRPGVTSLMAFGAGGRTLTSRQVVVSQVNDSGVTIYRGGQPNVSYSCSTQCTRVGDAPAGKP